MANIETTQRIEALFERISSLIDQARTYAISAIKIAEVKTRYEVGRYILEDEQQGERAKYGEQVLKQLSARLMERYGADWTYDTLVRCRKFYQAYANASIVATALPQLGNQGEAPDSKQVADCGNGVATIQLPRFILSWSHYLILMRIENIEARSFYELECAQQQWSVKQLSRQVGSSLYERLALSRKKEEVMRLAQEGQTVEKPEDIIKNPLTLEFLGLKPETVYTESKLENAIISKMQQFLLELGKGFLFEARQKRFTFDERNFYVDLVFYNRLLKCYVLIDLKTKKMLRATGGKKDPNWTSQTKSFDFSEGGEVIFVPTNGVLKEGKKTVVEYVKVE